MFEVTTDDEINHINIEAVRQEKLRNKKYIVASKAEILIKRSRFNSQKVLKVYIEGSEVESVL